MRLLVAPRYTAMGASSRVRMLQYLPALAAAGAQIQLQSLFADTYLQRLYAGRGRSLPLLAADYTRRVRGSRPLRRFDVVWLEKEWLPGLPWWLERRLLGPAARLVVDYDDAVFHNYDLADSALGRRLLGTKIDRIMAAASLVTAGNQYLADRASRAGARHVEIVPTVIDLERYPESNPYRFRDQAQRRIVWIGTPATAKYLLDIAPALARVCALTGARLRVIGAPGLTLPGVELESVAWSEDAEVSALMPNAVGIMPLRDSPWERGKCGYKVIQYMACSLPVVASPVGVNREIVEHGGNGWLATAAEEWERRLTLLLTDAEQAQRFGDAGRRRVAATYCLQRQAPRIVQWLTNLAKD